MALLLSACNAISSIVGVPTDTKETWEKVQGSKFKLVSLDLGRDSRPGKELDNVFTLVR